jgi:hypothetical protein
MIVTVRRYLKRWRLDYGLNFPSFSTQAYFFDYDKDGDLDMLLVNHNPKRQNSLDEITVSRFDEQNRP